MKKLLALWLSFALLCLVGCGEAPDEPEKEATPVELTVMSWNLLNPAWGGGPVAGRSAEFVQTISERLPDVLGVQEASATWHEAFASLPSSYAAICATSNGGDANMTAFLYNTDTLTLIDNGVQDLDTNSAIRVVSWAVLEANANGARFLITNTHPDSREAPCILHTEKALDIVADLQAAHDLPLLSVGDFNAIEGSAAYKLLIGSGYTDCKYAEGVELINDIDSYLLGDYGGKITMGQGSRDHVFFKGDVTPLTFETIGNDTTRIVSDHLPVVATMQLEK